MRVDWEGFNPDQESRPRTRLGYVPIPTVILCRYCAFWVKERSVFGSCMNEKFVKDYAYRDDQNTLATDAVVVEIDEGWGFQTGPDFGCIHGAHKLEADPRARDPLPQDDA